MTVERSWLLPDADEDDAKREGAMWYEGWLVPDGRLEAIIDTWGDTDVIAKRHISIVSPRLAEALDAPTEEGSDEPH